jgi:hypothetical protein
MNHDQVGLVPEVKKCFHIENLVNAIYHMNSKNKKKSNMIISTDAQKCIYLNASSFHDIKKHLTS